MMADSVIPLIVSPKKSAATSVNATQNGRPRATQNADWRFKKITSAININRKPINPLVTSFM